MIDNLDNFVSSSSTDVHKMDKDEEEDESEEQYLLPHVSLQRWNRATSCDTGSNG